jgi:hypothetical protein
VAVVVAAGSKVYSKATNRPDFLQFTLLSHQKSFISLMFALGTILEGDCIGAVLRGV